MQSINNKNKSDMIFLVFLGIVSIALRFYGINRPDFYFDEAVQAMAIGNFIDSYNFENLYLFGHPPLFMFLIYFPALLFGVSEYTIRAVEAFFGTLAVFIVYYLAKLWYSKRAAILAAILFAVAPLPVIYARLSYGYGVAMFFTVASILAIEHLIKFNLDKKREILMIFVSGILIGLTFLTRYNPLPIFGLYWAFILSYAFFKEKNNFKRYLYYAFILHIIALVLFVTIVLIFGGIPRLIYTIQNFLFVIQQQSTELVNPFYYHIAVLFDGISPFLYVLLPFSIIYLLLHKKRTRTDILLCFLVIAFFLIVTMQARRFSRHQLVIYPLLIILLSRFIILFFSKHLKQRTIVLSSIIVLGTFLWAILSIHQTSDFNIWTQVGNYIDNNYDDSVTIHSGYIRNRQIKTHVSRNVDLSLNISTLNRGDLVVFAFLDENSTILGNSPFEDKSTIFKNKFAGRKNKNLEFPPDYYRYVLEHGKLVKTFNYKGGTAVWIYRIKDIKDKNLYANLGYEGLVGMQPNNTALFGLWKIVCSNWNKNNLITALISRITSEQQKREIGMRCSN